MHSLGRDCLQSQPTTVRLRPLASHTENIERKDHIGQDHSIGQIMKKIQSY